jgi:hypothetical protein
MLPFYGGLPPKRASTRPKRGCAALPINLISLQRVFNTQLLQRDR